MDQKKRLRIIYQVLQEIRASRRPVGWRKIKKKFNLKESQAKSIYQSVLDIQRLKETLPNNQPIINAPKLKFERKNNYSVFILCSDWHIGEVVNKAETQINEYNLEIAYARGLKYLEECGKILQLLEPKEVILAFNGDIVSGIIHQELEAQTNVLDQISVAAYLGALFVKTLKPTKIIGVYGNHGQIRQNGKKKSKNLKNNFDLFTYKIIELLTGRKVVTTTCPFLLEETNVGLCCFAHGDYVNGYAGLPMHAIMKKQLFVHNFAKMQGLPSPNYTFLAHFHEPQNLTQMNERVFINGTMMGSNEYAVMKGLICTPSQKIVVVGEDNVGEFNVNLNIQEGKEIPKEVFELQLNFDLG